MSTFDQGWMRMQRLGWTLFVTILMACGGSAATAQPDPVPMRVIVEGADTQATVTATTGANGTWIAGSAAQTRLLVGDDGQTYIGVWVEAPDAVATVARAPMALSIVVDTSGSMEGQKIAHARMATASLLETLNDGDIVSLYAFSNTVAELVPPTVVSAETRAMLNTQAQRLNAQGGTNMFDGIRTGQARLSSAPESHPVRRLVLISDGHANIGPSDPASMGTLAANGTEWGVQVSAIGVGLDYDEQTLAALAVQSSGRMYHLQHPSQMAVILEEELRLLQQTVATNAFIEIIPVAGVQILGVETMGATIENGRVRVPIGNLHAGQEREVLLRAQVNTNAVGSRRLASARLSYREPTGARQERQQSVDLAVDVTDDQALAASSAAPRVQAMVATHRASQAQLEAAELLNQGRANEAAARFDFAAEELERAATSVPAAAPVRQRLERQAGQARSGATRTRRARTQSERRSVTLEAADAAMDAYGY